MQNMPLCKWNQKLKTLYSVTIVSISSKGFDIFLNNGTEGFVESPNRNMKVEELLESFFFPPVQSEKGTSKRETGFFKCHRQRF